MLISIIAFNVDAVVETCDCGKSSWWYRIATGGAK